MKLHLLLLCLVVCVASASSILALCHDAERSALLQFKQGFSIHPSASIDPFRYPKTRYWKSSHNVANDCCEWDGVECDEHIGHVIGLDLSSSLLYGSILPNSPLFELIHLQALNLSDNNLRYSPIPSQLGRLLNLKYLNLSRSRVSGQVPIEVSTLSKLISLDLSLNIEPSSDAQLLQIQDPSLSMLVMNLTALEILSLSQVNISSQVPQTLANLTSLKILYFYSCNLNGSFPEEIFQLPQLQILSLASNTNLSGYVPEILESSKLQQLFLDGTSFFGQLPLSIGNASFLEILSLSSCNFEGSIPSSFGKLTRLTSLDLSSCNFEGSIPSSFGKLTQLISLDLSQNKFAGIIPRSITNLTQLSLLSLSNNTLAGEMPPLANLTKLIFLDFSYNYFQGSIRKFISGLENLGSLSLEENNFNGPVEFDIFVTSKNLQALSLSNVDLIVSTTTHNNSYYPQFVYLDFTRCNLLRFPNFIQNQTRLSHLALGNNRIRGPLPVPPPSLVVFDMQANALEGEIPTNICNATTLKILTVAGNSLCGKIPPCLCNLSNNLAALVLGYNSLHGTIPDAFTNSCTMKWFHLGGNQVEGALPRSLANCSSLEVLALQGNNIVDTFPIWLSGLSELQVIGLQSNKFHGQLPLEVEHGFRKLYCLFLSNNHFTGGMSDDFFANLYSMERPSPQQVMMVVSSHLLDVETITTTYYFGVFNDFNKKNGMFRGSDFIPITIDLSHNKFLGKVSDSIGNLHTLQKLDLSYNNLTGAIPTSFEGLSNVYWLDLSHNSLSGEIPQQLTQLSYLNHFDVSYNQLTGPIPQGGQLTTFENDSFIGNPGLCGSPLSKKCGNHEVLAPPHDSSVEEDEGSADVIGWVIRCMGYISGLVVGLALGRMITDENHDWFVETFGRRQQRKKKKR